MSSNTGQCLKVGILGCRGIPNRYGGYEQFAQYLSEGLVARGHRVWVYQSSLHPYGGEAWHGVRLIRQPDPEGRLGSFGQFIYDFNCLRDAGARGFDILLQLGYTSSAILFPFWPSGPLNIVHMDGLEWKRTKYSAPARIFLRRMEALAARKGEVLIADSTVIRTYLLEGFGREAEYIPYGAPTAPVWKKSLLGQFGVKAGHYYLAIARMTPENNLVPVIEGVLEGGGGLPILVVGDTGARHGRYLVRRFRGNGRVVFTGSIFEFEALNSLRHFTRLYFHGHSVGGTNPSLLEAMACGAPICAHDNAFNRSVLEGHAFYFKDRDDICHALAERERRQASLAAWAGQNLAKIRMEYDWEKVIDSYEALFLKHKKTGM